MARAALRNELSSLPDETFAERVNAATHRQAQLRAIEESRHFYNRPDAKIDATFVASMPYWTPDEAVAATLGKNPSVVTWERCYNCTKIYSFCAEFEHLRDMVRRAVEAGQLPARIPPDEYLTWAAPRGLPIYPPLKAAIELLSNSLHAVTETASPVTAGGSNVPTVIATVIPPYASMDGLLWHEITLEFVSDVAVRVRARGHENSYGFEVMGFKDGRSRTAEPDELWIQLRTLAITRGPLKFSSPNPKWKRRMSDLRKRLRKLFPISGDPLPYQHGEGYKAAFTILASDEMHRAYDQRSRAAQSNRRRTGGALSEGSADDDDDI